MPTFGQKCIIPPMKPFHRLWVQPILTLSIAVSPALKPSCREIQMKARRPFPDG